MSFPLVWFLLVDSATGQLYKGTTADIVSLPPGYVIAQFRDAVKAKYSDSHLKGIASSNLLVYENKTAFDKRNLENEKVLLIFIIATGRAPRRRLSH